MRKNKEELKQYYFVIKQLVDREIKRKYARSFLGVIWSVLNPLMTMAVMSMIFSTIFKRTIENYPIYYLTEDSVGNKIPYEHLKLSLLSV